LSSLSSLNIIGNALKTTLVTLPKYTPNQIN
jgi:hypothetical protein